MKLCICRTEKRENVALGDLLIDGVRFCNTLDPLVVPEGTYKVRKYKSPHFGYFVPQLQDVPGHTEIEIHIGNFPRDTTGCFLVGFSASAGYEKPRAAIYSSRNTFEALMEKLEVGFLQDDVALTVQNKLEL